MPSVPSTQSSRLSFLRVAWRHLGSRWESSAGAALALLMALLPAGLVLVNGTGARLDVRTLLASSGAFGVQRQAVATPVAFDAFQEQVQGRVAPRLGEYMDGGSARIAATPFRVVSIHGNPPTTPAGAADAGVTYVADLPARVDVVQGLFPKPIEGTTEQMATMPLAVADRLGLQLFDVVCIGVSQGGAPVTEQWCARIVGLWRPMAGADPSWTAPDAQVQLFTERDDFFKAADLVPAQGVTASRQYAPRPDAITPQNADTAAQRVREARAAIGAANLGQVRTALDTGLSRYVSQTGTSFPVELVAAALVPLLLLLAVVMARWYVEPRLHELALLRARGWTRGRVQRLVLTELVLLGAPAFVVAVVGMLAVIWQAGDGPPGFRRVSLSAGELLAIAVAIAVLVVAAVRFVGLAMWSSQQNVLRSNLDESRPARPTWRGADATGLLVVPAALLLVIPRLAGNERWRLPGALNDLGALILSVGGLVVLVVAALPLLSLVAGAVGRGGGRLEWAMTEVQLRRWWQRNAAAGFLVILAFAVASFSAVALVDQVLNGPSGALGQGIAVSLAIGFVSALATALLAYGLVFLVSCRSRVDYYAALLVDGLPATTVRRSVQIEQHAVLLHGLVVGLVVGLVLVIATSPRIGLGGQVGALASAPHPIAVVIGLVLTAVLGLVAGRLVARTVRENVVGFRLVEQGWRST